MSSHPVPSDARYEIQKEFCGHARPHYCLRWCGEWIASDPSYAPLVDAALVHLAEREDAMDREFGTTSSKVGANPVTIHRLTDPFFCVESFGNGWAYAVQFGSAMENEPCQTIWVQDDEATTLRDRVAVLEDENPDVRYDQIYALALEEMGRL